MIPCGEFMTELGDYLEENVAIEVRRRSDQGQDCEQNTQAGAPFA